ncbi:MAG: hypothetical protein EOO40_08970, partial [Deltaproteobacteria bacterium]
NLAAVGLYMVLLARLVGPRRTLLATLLLVSLPAFSLYARIATENFALNPLCAVGGTLCLRLGWERRGWGWPSLAGALFALGTYNHLVFVAYPLALGLAMLCGRWRRQLWRSAALALLGFTLCYAVPTGWQLLHPEGQTFVVRARRIKSREVLHRLLQTPRAVGEMLHGDMLYFRFAGEVAEPAPPLTVAMGLLCGAILLAAVVRRAPHWQTAGFLGLTALFTVLFLQVMVPNNTLHYFLLLVWMLPVAMVLALRHVRARLTLAMALLALCGNNVRRTYVNMVASPQARQGRCGAVAFADNVVISSHFTDVRPLYEALRARQIEVVWAEPLIGWSLQALDLGRDALQVRIVKQDDLRPRPPPGTLIAEYRAPPHEASTAEWAQARTRLHLDNFLVREVSAGSATEMMALPSRP